MRFFQLFIRYVKGRPVLLDEKVTAGYLSRLCFEKTFALLRGLVKARKLIFLGRGTSVRKANQLFAARGVEISDYCQVDCLSHHGISIGRGAKIGSHSIVKVSGTLSDLGQRIDIGSNVGIGEFSHIGGAGPVRIGDETIAGAYLSIHPENHNFGDTSKPIRLQGVSRRGITIGRGCWIGAKVTFLDGSAIGDGCVVAAGAVVTKVFPDHVVIGGVPARVIKELSLH